MVSCWSGRVRCATVLWVCFSRLGFVPAGFGQADPVSFCIRHLKDSASDVRRNAAEALGNLKARRAVGPLIVTLKDTDAYVRQSAAYALGEISDKRAVEPLITSLKDANAGVRAFAASALGKIKDRRIVEPLIAALTDEEAYVRQSAAFGLIGIKDPRGVDLLMGALRERDPAVLAGAYNFFIERGEPGSEQTLIATLDKITDSYIATNIAKAFLNCGNRTLKNAAKAWARRHAVPIMRLGSRKQIRWGSGR